MVEAAVVAAAKILLTLDTRLVVNAVKFVLAQIARVVAFVWHTLVAELITA